MKYLNRLIACVLCLAIAVGCGGKNEKKENNKPNPGDKKQEPGKTATPPDGQPTAKAKSAKTYAHLDGTAAIDFDPAIIQKDKDIEIEFSFRPDHLDSSQALCAWSDGSDRFAMTIESGGLRFGWYNGTEFLPGYGSGVELATDRDYHLKMVYDAKAKTTKFLLDDVELNNPKNTPITWREPKFRSGGWFNMTDSEPKHAFTGKLWEMKVKVGGELRLHCPLSGDTQDSSEKQNHASSFNLTFADKETKITNIQKQKPAVNETASEQLTISNTAVTAEFTGDWTMWGGTIGRNMVNRSTGLNMEFDPETKKNLLWTAKLGSQTYGNPVVSGGKILVGTNNGAGYRPKHPAAEDRGVVLCFDEKTGDFLWQLTRKKLPIGRVSDWPLQGICSCPVIEGDKAYVVTNRAEVVCLDMEGFNDGENDGPFDQEEDKEKGDGDVIWSLDMIEELGVFPHNLATSSPVIYKDHLFLVTSNGVDESHKKIPATRSPSFLCINKNTGKVVWEDRSPGRDILHGQWSSPAVGVVNGKGQVYMPGGNGWLYAFDAEAKENKLVWKFDLNPKETVWKLGGEGERNAIIGTPVFYENSVILGVGQDPEHGNGVGHLYRIDATKTGDVSPELGEQETKGKPNPNSGQIWHYGGIDVDGSVTGEAEEAIYSRTVSTAAVHDGLVYAADLYGILHCLDLETGKRIWAHDTFSAIWGSPMVVDGKVLLGTEDNDLWVMQAGKEMKEIKKVTFDSSVYTTPTIANGKMYVSDRSTLYAIDVSK